MSVKTIAILFASVLCSLAAAQPQDSSALQKRLSAYVEKFNADDDELYVNSIPNSEAEKFMLENVPLFECPDEDITATYYFRWWTFRKHVEKTPDGFVITEFMPKVEWAGKYNTIACPAAHQIREARWLRNGAIAADYARFWKTAKHVRSFSFWYADTVWQLHLARPDKKLLRDLYPALKANVAAWEKSNFDPENGLFWQRDLADGMELSISGALNARWCGYRPTINSYMYADYAALSKIAEVLGDQADAKLYAEKAEKLGRLINEKLWDSTAKFYKVMPKNGYDGRLADVRELHGYTPWYFGIAPKEYAEAWKQITLTDGFKSKFGLTTAERRDGRFRISYIGHECQWNGPVWPFSTSITLTALANFLNDFDSRPVDKADYFDALKTYAASHTLTKPDGKKVFWIDECQHPDTGDWITRTRLLSWDKRSMAYKKERGKDYNHSTFADLVITGLVGLRPSEGDCLELNPLAPESWKYFRLENLEYKNAAISIYWDADGSRYGRGAGLSVFANGKCIARADRLGKLSVKLAQ